LADRNAFRLVVARFVSRSGTDAAFFVGIWGKPAFEFDATPTHLAVLTAALGLAGLAGSVVAEPLINRVRPPPGPDRLGGAVRTGRRCRERSPTT
jgi:hypothetical protein